MANGNPFAITPAGDMSQGLAGLSNVLAQVGEQRQQQQLLDQQAAQKRAQQEEVQAAFDSGDPMAMADVSLKYPDMRESIDQATGMREDFQREDMQQFLTKLMTNPQEADQLYQQRIRKLEAQGRDPSETIASYQKFQEDPEAAMQGNEIMFATRFPEEYKSMQEAMAGPEAEDRPTPYTDIGKITSDLQAGLIDEEQAGNLIEQAGRPTGEGDQRDRKIASLANMLRGAEGIENPEELATKWHDGVLDVEVLDSGFVRMIDGEAVLRGEGDKAVYELPINALQGVETEAAQPDQGLYDLADETAGIGSGLSEMWGRIAGQVGAPVPENTLEARQTMNAAGQRLINALRQNPRYTEGEANRLQQEVNITPNVFDSPDALRARMRSIDSSLRTRLEQENAAANDPQMPADSRAGARDAARNIENFLDLLQVPQAVKDSDLTPEFIGELNPDAARDMVRNRLTDEQINNLSDEQYNLLMEKVRGQ